MAFETQVVKGFLQNNQMTTETTGYRRERTPNT